MKLKTFLQQVYEEVHNKLSCEYSDGMFECFYKIRSWKFMSAQLSVYKNKISYRNKKKYWCKIYIIQNIHGILKYKIKKYIYE